jgi:AraC-like DNA-binding protein
MDCLNIHLAEPEFNVGQLGKEIGFSRAQLYRKVLALTDQTPSELIRNTRLRMAARMFKEGHKNVTRVMYAVGFNNSSYFAKCFFELYGSNPSEYLDQNKHSR